MYGVYLLVKRI